MLVEVARLVKTQAGGAIVEHAHMELAEPTVEQAFEACLAKGAEHVAVLPYFLAPGRHSTVDIPRLAAEAAGKFPGITYTVTEPLGIDWRMIDLVLRRVDEALAPEASRR